ncbi:MAG TPA: glucose 1-dehydrogenase [Casimicrobiaceae bacterium]|jgi:NAD(P)-dependent dehydrogenase (short-subunit alcohol dehydrogenase family)|nr:glucose 1-dehydrogenase [Casimicrobiaceae bacterium]
MQLRLDGKVALVTGAFGGLGRDFARMLARAGASVALAGRRREAGEELAIAMRAEGASVAVVAMDVTDRASVDASIAEAAAALGEIDVLVNNAGVAITRPFLDLTESDWKAVLDVNLDGAFRVAQAVARRMRDAGRAGSIVNVASVLAGRVAAQVAPYATSKAALVQLTRAMALELARHRIRVNALAPGYIETPLNRDFFASEGGAALVKRIPQRRLGRVEDLEAPLLLLASDASAYMTGATIAVDGGHAVSSL